MYKRLLSSFLIMATGVGFGFIVHLALARFLGAGEYGSYNFIYSVASTVSILAMFGLQTSVVRLIPTYLMDQADHIRTLIKFSALFTTALSLICGALAFGGIYMAGLSDTYGIAALLAGFVLVPCLVLLKVNSGILRGFKRANASVFYEMTFREIMMCAVIGLFLVLNISLDGALIILIALIFIHILGVLFSSLHIARCKKTLPAHDKNNVLPRPYREWLQISFPMLLIIAAKRFLQRTDIIMLGFMVSPALLGAYALAANFSDTASLASRPSLAVFSPRAATYFKAGDKAALRKLYLHTTLFISAVHVSAALIIAVAAPYVLPYFGADFMQAYPSLLILLSSIAIGSLCGPVGNLLIMTQYEKQAMNITAVLSLVNIVFNPVLIYFYSIEGAALTTAAVIIIWNVWCGVVILQKKILTD